MTHPDREKFTEPGPPPGLPAPGTDRAPVVPNHDQSPATSARLALLAGALLGAAILVAPWQSAGSSAASASRTPSEWAGALLAAAACVLAGGLAGRLLRSFAAIAESLENGRSAAAMRDAQILDALERVAQALERPSAPALAPAQAPPTPAVQFREAIQLGEWERADALVRDLLRERPDDAEAKQLAAELVESRRRAADDIQARLSAAREVGDSDRVLELRDALTPLLDGNARGELDRELARWFMGLIQKRLRTGTMLTDVAVLAGRVADRLDATPEGASLRAALPTLRRSGGLCARCGQPYRGIADACPACLSKAPLPAIVAPEEMSEEHHDTEEHEDSF